MAIDLKPAHHVWWEHLTELELMPVVDDELLHLCVCCRISSCINEHQLYRWITAGRFFVTSFLIWISLHSPDTVRRDWLHKYEGTVLSILSSDRTKIAFLHDLCSAPHPLWLQNQRSTQTMGWNFAWGRDIFRLFRLTKTFRAGFGQLRNLSLFLPCFFEQALRWLSRKVAEVLNFVQRIFF